MNLGKRNTQKFAFKNSDLKGLRELATLVVDPEDFRHRHGRILSILYIFVPDGILNTLVQFYDPLYHRFTFPDYQLMPTLEEYSFWMGIPVSDQIPFSGREKIPKVQDIAKALHLRSSDIRLITKGGIQGLTTESLMEKASLFSKSGSVDAFDAHLALLIYGLVLFPNLEGFVDMNAIQIFLNRNPVPTLVGDAYHSIHHRTLKGGGTIICCAQLLYRWFISYLPQSRLFKDNPNKLRWSQRIMSLTHADIHFYVQACDPGSIIDSCGQFSNVPLLGIRGGISYNHMLARRQFGYPMKCKPDNVYLTGFFYLKGEDDDEWKSRIESAWHKIHRKEHNQLGRKHNLAAEPYTQWVHARACSLKMPYPLEPPKFTALHIHYAELEPRRFTEGR